MREPRVHGRDRGHDDVLIPLLGEELREERIGSLLNVDLDQMCQEPILGCRFRVPWAQARIGESVRKLFDDHGGFGQRTAIAKQERRYAPDWVNGQIVGGFLKALRPLARGRDLDRQVVRIDREADTRSEG